MRSHSGFLGGGVGPTAIKRRSGLAAPVPVAGAELLANGNMEAGDPPTGWLNGGSATLSAATDERSGGSGTKSINIAVASGSIGEAYRAVATTANGWLRASVWRKNINAANGAQMLLYTGGFALISSGASSADAAWNETVVIARSPTTSSLIFLKTTGAVGTAARFDDAAMAMLSLPSLFSTRTYASADCDLSAAVMRAVGTQAGFVARLDSATTPANFVIAYLDGAGNVKVDKCVAGVYTNVISGAVTYVAGRVLRLVCNGTSVSAYYNGTQVGTTQTVADAGIVSNTRHGLFSTYAANSFAGYVAA